MRRLLVYEAIGNLNEFNSCFGTIETRSSAPTKPAGSPGTHQTATCPRVKFFSVLEARSGFPLAMVTEDRYFVEPRDGGRYPMFVSLDAQVMKRIRFFSRHASVGVKMFNVTNHFNPREFQGSLASDSFETSRTASAARTA